VLVEDVSRTVNRLISRCSLRKNLLASLSNRVMAVARASDTLSRLWGLPVFQSAATFPSIFIASKDRQDNVALTFTQVGSLEAPYPDLSAVIRQSGTVLSPEAINLNSLFCMRFKLRSRKLSTVKTEVSPHGKNEFTNVRCDYWRI